MKLVKKIKDVYRFVYYIWLVIFNAVAALFLPRIDIGAKNGLTFKPTEIKDFPEINNIYKLAFGEGDLPWPGKWLLFLCGRKMFVKVIADGKIIGYKVMHFHFGELVTKRYIHSASSAMLADYRGGGRGKTMYYATWDWYQYHTWVKGISSRYELSNAPVKYLHENYGSYPIKHYMCHGEEWVYSVKKF